MDLKGFAVLIVFLVFILPGLVGIIVTSIKSAVDPSPENIGKSVEEVAKQSIPWWVGVIEWFAQLPNQIASVLLLGFIFFLIWIGVFK
jgi:hypothetical protein